MVLLYCDKCCNYINVANVDEVISHRKSGKCEEVEKKQKHYSVDMFENIKINDIVEQKEKRRRKFGRK